LPQIVAANELNELMLNLGLGILQNSYRPSFGEMLERLVEKCQALEVDRLGELNHVNRLIAAFRSELDEPVDRVKHSYNPDAPYPRFLPPGVSGSVYIPPRSDSTTAR